MANEKVQKVLLKRTTKTNAPNVPSGASYGELFINIASGTNAHNKIATKQIGTGTPIVWSDDVANDKKYATKTSIPTSGTVSGWGFTKNAGTVTGVTVKGTNGLTGSGTVSTSGTITISGVNATTGATGVSKLVTGDLKSKTYTAGEAAAAAHTHGQYLTAETYKGTVTGVTAGNGLTGGGNASTGRTGLTLNVGAGTGIAVGTDTVGINTDYQNKISSGVSAYTMVKAFLNNAAMTGTAIDTLVEIQNYISSAGSATSQLLTDVSNLKNNKVDKTTTVNGQALSGNVTINKVNSATTAKYLSNIGLNFTPADSALTPDNVRTLLGDGGTIKRGFWAYASNGYITSATTGIGAIDLAGTTVIQAVGNQNCYTQLYLTPSTSTTTGAKKNEIFMYNNNGSNYQPSWTRVLTNRNCNEFKIASATTADSSAYAKKVEMISGTGNSYRDILVTNGSNGVCYAGNSKVQLNYSTGDVKASSFTGTLKGPAAALTNVANTTGASIQVGYGTSVADTGCTGFAVFTTAATPTIHNMSKANVLRYIDLYDSRMIGLTGNTSGIEIANYEYITENNTFNTGVIKVPTGTTSGTCAVGNHTHASVKSATTVYSTTGSTSSTYQLLGTTASSSGAYGTIGSSLSTIKMNPYSGTLSATTFVGNLNGKIKATTGTSKYYLLGHSLSATGFDSVYKNANVYMSSGALYASSDERLKTFIENVDGDPEKIKQIPKVYFHWNDDEEKNRQLGTFAQGLEKVYPELVCKDEDGIRGVSYDKLSVVSLAGIDKLYEMIQELQKKNEELEKRIKDLENK